MIAQNTLSRNDSSYSFVPIGQSQYNLQELSHSDYFILDQSENEIIIEHPGKNSVVVQTDMPDFTIIEKREDFEKNDFKFLLHQDWQNIIDKQSYAMYRSYDIYVSLLTSKLNFTERRKLWLVFCNYKKNREEYNKNNKQYELLKVQQNKYVPLIQKDACRPGLERFYQNIDNQNSLIYILTAYSNLDPELGYTQGMNVIVANLLLCYDMSQNDERLSDYVIIDMRDETVYYIFVHIMIKLGWRTLFMDGFPGLISKLNVLNQKIQQQLPDIYKHFEKEDVLEMYNSVFQQFYLTVMMYDAPWKFSRTILDLFLFQGEEFLHNLILAMLRYSAPHLFHLRSFQLGEFCRTRLMQDFCHTYMSYEAQLTRISVENNLEKRVEVNKSFITFLKQVGLIQCQQIEDRDKHVIKIVSNHLKNPLWEYFKQ